MTSTRSGRPGEGLELTALRMGMLSGGAVTVLCGAYVAVLAVGLFTLPAPDQPIRQPWFGLLELLILAIAPARVVLV